MCLCRCAVVNQGSPADKLWGCAPSFLSGGALLRMSAPQASAPAAVLTLHRTTRNLFVTVHHNDRCKHTWRLLEYTQRT